MDPLDEEPDPPDFPLLPDDEEEESAASHPPPQEGGDQTSSEDEEEPFDPLLELPLPDFPEEEESGT